MAGIEGLRSLIVERWTELEAGFDSGQEGHLSTVDTPVTGGAGHLLLAVGSDGRRLLVPMTTEERKQFRDDRRSKAVQLVARQLGANETLTWYADLRCTNAALNEVFASLVADAVARVEVDRDRSAIQTVKRCLADWRALLVAGKRLLSTRELAGLFGELTLLISLMERDPSSLSTWRGPLHEPHDFRRGDRAVEVKTSLADDQSVVVIHGLAQLDPPEGGDLLLHHLRVVEAVDGGLTVPDLVERALSLGDSAELLQKLKAAGYDAAQEEAYQRTSFSLLEEKWYDVDASFPRIASSTFGPQGVPSAIGVVTYELDLGHIMSEATTDRVKDQLDALVTK